MKQKMGFPLLRLFKDNVTFSCSFNYYGLRFYLTSALSFTHPTELTWSPTLTNAYPPHQTFFLRNFFFQLTRFIPPPSPLAFLKKFLRRELILLNTDLLNVFLTLSCKKLTLGESDQDPLPNFKS